MIRAPTASTGEEEIVYDSTRSDGLDRSSDARDAPHDEGGGDPSLDAVRWAGVPQGMDLHTLAGGAYAVFGYRGRASDFAMAARYIYGEWLPGSRYELDDREYFEILDPGYRPDDPHATEKIWIPVRVREAPG